MDDTCQPSNIRDDRRDRSPRSGVLIGSRVALAVGVVAALSVVGAASASASLSRGAGTGVSVDCQSGDGDVVLGLDASFSVGPDGYVDAFVQFSDADESLAAPAAVEPTVAVGPFEVVADFGDAGGITITVSLSPEGEPTTAEYGERGARRGGHDPDGSSNTWSTQTFVTQPLAGGATVTVATGQLSSALGLGLSCTGLREEYTSLGSSPNTTLQRGALPYSGTCEVLGLGERSLLFVGTSDRQTILWLRVGLVGEWPEDPASLKAEALIPFEGRELSGDLLVTTPFERADEPVAVQLHVDGAVIDPMKYESTLGGDFRALVKSHRMTGHVMFLDGTVGSLETDCEVTELQSVYRTTRSAGQKPGGHPPKNDLPADAIDITPGEQDTTRTRGATVAPEAACIEEWSDVELPWGRTAWYRFEGTGADVHLTTEQSDFDTVIAVYAETSGSPGDQLACVDDVPLSDPFGPWQSQAEVTIGTELGVGYLVQVGGFAPFNDPNESEFGALIVEIE